MRISDWSSDVCSSDLRLLRVIDQGKAAGRVGFEPDVGFEPPVARYFVGKLLCFVGKRGDIQAGGIARRRQCTGRRLQVALGIRTRRQHVVVAVQLGGQVPYPARRVPALALRGQLGFVEAHRDRSEEHTSELTSLMRSSYDVF